MRYRSIAGECPDVTFRDALLTGIAPDGSLYIPGSFPGLNNTLLPPSGQSLHRLGYLVASAFIDDIPETDLKNIIKSAWDFPVPLKHLGNNIYLLELFHGPTLAFKDVGARFMATVLDHYMRRENRQLKIIVATSGDTGSAVAHGFHGADRIDVYILYPSGKISSLQEKQMTTLGGNIHAIEVDGVFDDCQRLVKEALADKELSRNGSITTANSINLGRLLPQITYYLWGYVQWKSAENENSQPPVFVVPSGNFGNLTAALYANRMGMPATKFIAATNSNDIVPEYLNTGKYNPRPSEQTLSNAMDVGDPGNWSRIQALYGNDIERIRRDIDGISVNDDETIDEIKQTYNTTGYLLDPHTAVGVRAVRKVGGDAEDSVPYIVAATAHPAKFKDVIEKHLNITIPLPEPLARCLDLPKQSVSIGAEFGDLRDVILRRDEK